MINGAKQQFLCLFTFIAAIIAIFVVVEKRVLIKVVTELLEELNGNHCGSISVANVQQFLSLRDNLQSL